MPQREVVGVSIEMSEQSCQVCTSRPQTYTPCPDQALVYFGPLPIVLPYYSNQAASKTLSLGYIGSRHTKLGHSLCLWLNRYLCKIPLLAQQSEIGDSRSIRPCVRIIYI